MYIHIANGLVVVLHINKSIRIETENAFFARFEFVHIIPIAPFTSSFDEKEDEKKQKKTWPVFFTIQLGRIATSQLSRLFYGQIKCHYEQLYNS